MGDVVKVLTIVPRQIAQTISSDSRIQNYNALPQLSQRAMQIIRGSLGIDKELDCSYKPSTVLNWCGDNLYGFALRRWCNVNI